MITGRTFWLTLTACCLVLSSASQKIPVIPEIDILLIEGKYQEARDSCRMMLLTDSLNPELYYKMGIASQNLMNDELALRCFLRASTLDGDNSAYRFSLGKAWFNDGKFRLAEPVFQKLCEQDTSNWSYAWHLASVYLQTEKYDDAMPIYDRLWRKDSTNSLYCDKIAFTWVKKGEVSEAIRWYSKSLTFNPINLTALKNLSFLYASMNQADTAVALLTKGISIDSTDLDLFVRRAQVNFSKSYTKRALDDYLVLLAAGDSSTLFLKRAGIGYCYNLQPRDAIVYLLKAYQADSTDYETCNYLGQCYYLTKDQVKSIYFYNRAIKILSAVNAKMALTYALLGDSQKEKKEYNNAIGNYLKAYAINGDANLSMVVANIYDEKLNNREKAIFYYQRFLNTEKMARMKLPPDYILRVSKRLEYLKKTIKK